MKKKQFLLFLLLVNTTARTNSQTYKDSINTYREKHLEEFLTDDHPPLAKQELQYIAFFDPDIAYRISATFKKTINAAPFDLATLNGSSKKYAKNLH